MSEETEAAPPPAERGAERPPFGSWAGLYVFVVAMLALDILLLWWLTERYR